MKSVSQSKCCHIQCPSILVSPNAKGTEKGAALFSKIQRKDRAFIKEWKEILIIGGIHQLMFEKYNRPVKIVCDDI